MEVITKSRTEYYRELRHKHKLLGLCGNCSQPVIDNHYRCLVCEMKERNRQNNPINQYRLKKRHKDYYLAHCEGIKIERVEKYNYRKDIGQCPRCGVPLLEEEIVYCMNCVLVCNGKYGFKGVLKYETAD